MKIECGFDRELSAAQFLQNSRLDPGTQEAQDFSALHLAIDIVLRGWSRVR